MLVLAQGLGWDCVTETEWVIAEISHWIGLAAYGTVSCQEWNTALNMPSQFPLN